MHLFTVHRPGCPGPPATAHRERQWSTVWIDVTGPGKVLDTGPSIDSMTNPREPSEAAARLAAIEVTTGSANDIFEPDYLERLRHDWPD